MNRRINRQMNGKISSGSIITPLENTKKQQRKKLIDKNDTRNKTIFSPQTPSSIAFYFNNLIKFLLLH